MKRTPLKRKTRLRARSLTKKYRRRERDFDYMGKVRRLPCIVRSLHPLQYPDQTPCCGRVQADHAGTRGLGQKSADDTCIPLCRDHHGERTDYRGTFKNWSAPMMRLFNDWAIERTRREVAEMVS